MNLEAQLKVMGDSYAGGFSCGMTMTGSGTMERMRLVTDEVNCKTYISEEGLELNLSVTDLGDAKELVTSFINKSEGTVTLEMLSSFVISGIKADRIHRLQSGWSAEGKHRVESITDLHMERSWNGCAYRIEKFGNVGSMPVRKYAPVLVLEDSTSGRFLGVMLYLASSWQMEIMCRFTDELTIAGGIADRDFGAWTKKFEPGEHFLAPKAVIAEGDSFLEVCDKLVKTQRPAVSPVDEDMGIVYNEYCTTWGNPTYDNIKKIADKLEGKGIKYLVIDSGWYGNAQYWWDQVGDWTINYNRFPEGLKPIADYIRSKGMIPGLWFEMESVTSQSVHYNEAEHLVCKDGVPLTVGNRRFWDMENPWVVEYLSEKVIKLLRDNGFGYLKVDYNDTMGMGCDGEDGLGENLRRKVMASQEFFGKIAHDIPGIVIENCSSGGHRLEPSMMELCSMASFSDAHETKAIPLIAANVHNMILPKQSQIWAVLRAGDEDDRIHYSICSTLLGRMCLSGEIYDLSEHQWSLVDEGMRFYNKAKDIIRDGSTKLIYNCTEGYNEPQGSQLVVRMKDNLGLAILHRFENSIDISTVMTNARIAGKYKIHTIDTYGSADSDYSAQAWLFEIGEKDA